MQKREESMRRLEAESIPTLRDTAKREEEDDNRARRPPSRRSASTEEKLECQAEGGGVPARGGQGGRGDAPCDDGEEEEADGAGLQEKLAELNQSLTPLDVEVNVVNANLSVEKKRLDELDVKAAELRRAPEKLDSNTAQLFELQAQDGSGARRA